MSLDATRENIFQNDMIQHMQINGWVLGAAKNYDLSINTSRIGHAFAAELIEKYVEKLGFHT